MHWPAAYAAYNVFRRRQYPALRCAVRQDRPVPGFKEEISIQRPVLWMCFRRY